MAEASTSCDSIGIMVERVVVRRDELFVAIARGFYQKLSLEFRDRSLGIHNNETPPPFAPPLHKKPLGGAAAAEGLDISAYVVAAD